MCMAWTYVFSVSVFTGDNVYRSGLKNQLNLYIYIDIYNVIRFMVSEIPWINHIIYPSQICVQCKMCFLGNLININVTTDRQKQLLLLQSWSEYIYICIYKNSNIVIQKKLHISRTWPLISEGYSVACSHIEHTSVTRLDGY